MDSLRFILDKDLINENDLTEDINYKLANLETKKSQVKISNKFLSVSHIVDKRF